MELLKDKYISTSNEVSRKNSLNSFEKGLFNPNIRHKTSFKINSNYTNLACDIGSLFRSNLKQNSFEERNIPTKKIILRQINTFINLNTVIESSLQNKINSDDLRNFPNKSLDTILNGIENQT